MDRYFDEEEEELESTRQEDLNSAKKVAELLVKSGLEVSIEAEDEEELIRYIVNEDIEFTE